MLKNIPLLFLVTIFDLARRSNRTGENNFHVQKALEWLKNAQDAAGEPGGVSEGFHLVHGWLPPYPETTGYIIETFLDYFHVTENPELRERALRMADWLLKIQHEDGSIPDSYFKKKMVFDTGQVLFGLVKAFEESGKDKYIKAAIKSGNWLVRVQDNDGAWRKFAVDGIPHTYYSRVAWALLKLHSVTNEKTIKDAAIKNINWALSRQTETGWFDEASFNLKNHQKPFTHTIAYTLRGILEAGLYLNEEKFIASVKRAVDNLISHIDDDGFVCGTYDKNWQGDRSFCCLTGSAQLAIVMSRLFSVISDKRYLNKARAINCYLKSRQQLTLTASEVYGAIAGSWPIWGQYIHFTYPNWAAKFFIDSLLEENRMTDHV